MTLWTWVKSQTILGHPYLIILTVCIYYVGANELSHAMAFWFIKYVDAFVMIVLSIEDSFWTCKIV